MEASERNEPRVIRLAEAAAAIELDPNDLLGRLEAQAEEIGRLRARAESFERVARAERDARRRLSDTLKRERGAAEALRKRAEVDRAERETLTQEVERMRENATLNQIQIQQAWARLSETEQRLAAYEQRGFLRRLFHRPPRVAG